MQEQLDAYKQSQEPDAASFDYICRALRQLALEAKGENAICSDPIKCGCQKVNRKMSRAAISRRDELSFRA